MFLLQVRSDWTHTCSDRLDNRQAGFFTAVGHYVIRLGLKRCSRLHEITWADRRGEFTCRLMDDLAA